LHRYPVATEEYIVASDKLSKEDFFKQYEKAA